ncbi:MAG: IS4 family transposase [Candidatus Paceibacterota bacterium]
MTKVTLFSQIISQLDRRFFGSLVNKHSSDKHNKGFNSWSHLISMLFCQFAKCTSVRDISNGLRSATGNLNHLGISCPPSKSTLSYQNKNRPWELFRDYYFMLYEQLGQRMGHGKIKFRIKSKILLLDSTLIALSLSLFDWAHYKTKKGAVKINTLLDYEGCLPVYVYITDGKTADNKAAYDMPMPKDSVIVSDRYYNDFHLLNIWDSAGVKFVIRHKKTLKFKVVGVNFIAKKNRNYVLSDENIELLVDTSKKKYPKKLRRVVVWDEKNQQLIELLTNQFTWSCETIANLYKSRWDIELFFRDIKQLLHIKSFIGTSQNAVMIQIWTALITILLLKAMKAKAQYNWHLSNLVAFLRLNLFVKIELQLWLDKPFSAFSKSPPINPYQGVLFK